MKRHVSFLYRALVQVDFVSTPIKRVAKDGIETVDGNKQELDILICATGAADALSCHNYPHFLNTRLRLRLPAWHPHLRSVRYFS